MSTATPVCPTCGVPAASEQVRVENGVATGDYLCDGGGHIWRTTWVKEPA